MGIRVRFQPISVNVASVRGGTFKVVTGGRLGLHIKGADAVPVGATSTKASLEFFEVPHAGRGQVVVDRATQPRQIAAIDGHIQVEKNVPKFAIEIGTFRQTPLVSDSDFTLDLEFDQKNFSQGIKDTGEPAPPPRPTLFLPWEVGEEGIKQEIGVQLTVGGIVHAITQLNDQLDVPLKHNGVREDGTSQTTFLDHFGVGTVYPSENVLLRAQDRIAIGSDPMIIVLHDSVRAGCNRLASGTFNFDTLRRAITTIVASGGFTNVRVEERNTAGVSADWVPRGKNGRFIALNVTDEDLIIPPDGKDRPFFEYSVFYERNVPSQRGESGNGESLNPANPVNVQNRTKRVITPIVLLGGGGQFDTTYQLTSPAEQMNLVANLIVHEIGHGLGLRHGVVFDGTRSYSLSGGIQRGTMMQVRGRITAFGPVHSATLRRHFL